MRKKPGMQNSGGGGYSNNRPRRPGGGSNGGGSNHNNHNRPRKNYGAAREKYLAQARDALAAGDRVLAENYFQHAEHCYRMMMEEGHHTRHQQNQQQEAAIVPQNDNQDEVEVVDNASPLPAFLTGGLAAQPVVAAEPAVQQEWEE